MVFANTQTHRLQATAFFFAVNSESNVRVHDHGHFYVLGICAFFGTLFVISI